MFIMRNNTYLFTEALGSLFPNGSISLELTVNRDVSGQGCQLPRDVSCPGMSVAQGCQWLAGVDR